MRSATAFGVIYAVYNTGNGKVYIGQTTQETSTRWKQHIADRRRKNHHLHNAIRKNGADAFNVSVLCEAYSRPELDAAEIMAIGLFQSQDSRYGYNDSFGGEGGKHSPETLEKMRQNGRDRRHSSETKQKIALSMIGRRNWNFGGSVPRNDSRKGYRMSEEERTARTLAAKVGWANMSPETKATRLEKIQAFWRARKEAKNAFSR